MLIPGIGAQGGNLQEVAKYGINKECGLLVNNSRAIIYAFKSEKYKNSPETDFSIFAAVEAHEIQNEMKEILTKNELL